MPSTCGRGRGFALRASVPWKKMNFTMPTMLVEAELGLMDRARSARNKEGGSIGGFWGVEEGSGGEESFKTCAYTSDSVGPTARIRGMLDAEFAPQGDAISR